MAGVGAAQVSISVIVAGMEGYFVHGSFVAELVTATEGVEALTLVDGPRQVLNY